MWLGVCVGGWVHSGVFWWINGWGVKRCGCLFVNELKYVCGWMDVCVWVDGCVCVWVDGCVCVWVDG